MSWPFDRWQQIAIRHLGLAPSEFWAMPLRDWLRLLEGTRRPGVDGATLADLLTRFPDTGGPHDPDR